MLQSSSWSVPGQSCPSATRGYILLLSHPKSSWDRTVVSHRFCIKSQRPGPVRVKIVLSQVVHYLPLYFICYNLRVGLSRDSPVVVRERPYKILPALSAYWKRPSQAVSYRPIISRNLMNLTICLVGHVMKRHIYIVRLTRLCYHNTFQKKKKSNEFIQRF